MSSIPSSCFSRVAAEEAVRRFPCPTRLLNDKSGPRRTLSFSTDSFNHLNEMIHAFRKTDTHTSSHTHTHTHTPAHEVSSAVIKERPRTVLFLSFMWGWVAGRSGLALLLRDWLHTIS